MSIRKGLKGQKNISIFHDEVKESHTIVLTLTAWLKLKNMAQKQGLSISKKIEQWVRNTAG